MRERKTWLVVTFHTTAAAIGMEKLCAARGLAGRLIPAYFIDRPISQFQRLIELCQGSTWVSKNLLHLIAESHNHFAPFSLPFRTVLGKISHLFGIFSVSEPAYGKPLRLI